MTNSSLAESFGRQVRCQVTRRINVSAGAAWTVVGDIGTTVPTGDLVERVEVDGEGAGAIRTYHLAGGASAIVERIEEYDAAAREYVYRIIDSGPLPMARYLGLAAVAPAGPSACILSWIAMADPLDGDAEALTAVLQANLVEAVGAIARHLEGSTDS